MNDKELANKLAEAKHGIEESLKTDRWQVAMIDLLHSIAASQFIIAERMINQNRKRQSAPKSNVGDK